MAKYAIQQHGLSERQACKCPSGRPAVICLGGRGKRRLGRIYCRVDLADTQVHAGGQYEQASAIPQFQTGSINGMLEVVQGRP